jgi:Tfp pilus assembly protein PilP
MPMVARWIAAFVVALGAVLAASCGGDAPSSAPPAPPPRPAKPAAAQPTGGAGVDELSPDDVVIPKGWESIQPFVEKYSNEPASTKTDPFRNMITAHIAKPDIAEELAALEQEEKVEAGELPVMPQSPLERYSIEEYELLFIMSGTVTPKAVLQDPVGNTWVVRKDSPVGKNGGVVQAITQYSLYIREPESEQPIEKTLKPPIFDLAHELGGGDGATTGVERLTGPPHL